MRKQKKLSPLLLVLVLVAVALFVVLPMLRGGEVSLPESAGQTQPLQDLGLLELPAGDSGDLAPETGDAERTELPEDGSYTSKEDVCAYLIAYGHLPANFITKKEAKAAGWTGGALEPYCPGKCIGGDRFGNMEGLLPDASGRSWTECDIDTLGARSRGAKRLVWSNDGLIYYTHDHYESFELLYGEP